MIDHIRKLFEHAAWADERVLSALGQGGPPSGRALELYAHVLGAEHIWLARLHGKPSDVAVWPEADLEQCAALSARAKAGYADYVEQLDERALEEAVTYRNSAGEEFASRVDDILLHVALHGAYHRGQVALVERDGGREPSPTDYIAFVRGTPAATRMKPS